MSEDDDARSLTWAALLGRWMEFARSAVALPESGEGGRWKRAVAPIIGLQAVTHALGELDRLDPAERRLGLDRAEVLIRDHAAELHEIWRAQPLPDQLTELIDDARAALRAATSRGMEWVIATDALACEHPGELAEALASLGFDGDLYVPTPGIPMLAGEPAAFCRPRAGGPVDDDAARLVSAFLGLEQGFTHPPATTPAPRQVYRAFDFAAGGPVRDVITFMDAEPEAGQPLLVPAVLEGRPQPVTLPPRAPMLDEPLPVVDRTRGASADQPE